MGALIRRGARLILVLMSVAAIGLAVFMVFGSRQRVAAERPAATATAVGGGPTELLTVTGTLVPVRAVELAMPAAGTIRAIGAREGDSVAAGDVLVEIEGVAERNAVARATVEVERAQAALELAESRRDALGAGADESERAVADAEVTLAEQDVSAAEAELEAAEASLAATRLVAPFAGSVVGLEVEVGQRVSAERIVVRLADQSAWVVNSRPLTESESLSLAPDTPATVQFAAIADLTMPARVASLAVTSGPTEEVPDAGGDLRYIARLAVEGTDARLRWGLDAIVSIGTSPTS